WRGDRVPHPSCGATRLRRRTSVPVAGPGGVPGRHRVSPPMTIKRRTQLLEQRRPADPDTVFLEQPGGRTFTYGDLDRESARLANAVAAMGVRPGDRVAVQAEKSPTVLLVYLACVRAGAVLLPMNPAYTDGEVQYLLDDAEPALFVHDPSRATRRRVPVTATLDAAGDGSLVEAAATEPDE